MKMLFEPVQQTGTDHMPLQIFQLLRESKYLQEGIPLASGYCEDYSWVWMQQKGLKRLAISYRESPLTEYELKIFNRRIKVNGIYLVI